MGGILLGTWLHDVKRTEIFAIWDRTDLRPTFAQYKHYLFRFLHID